MYRKIFVHFWCAEKTGPNLFEEVFKNMVKIFGKADEIFVFSSFRRRLPVIHGAGHAQFNIVHSLNFSRFVANCTQICIPFS